MEVKKDQQYRNRYTNQLVTVVAIDKVHIGPGEIYKDVVVLKDGSRWATGKYGAGFEACHTAS